MSRYIDADALKPEYYDEYVVGDDEYVVRYYSEIQIDNAPSIDIVQCGECKYNSICNRDVQHTTRDISSVTIGYKSVEWCSYGEREGE